MKNKNKLTIQNLRRNGNKVKVTHLRRVSVNRQFIKDLSKPQYQYVKKGEFNLPPVTVLAPQVILSKGGETQITVDLANGKHYQVNTICSNAEPYSKKRGLYICLTRLFSQMEENGDI